MKPIYVETSQPLVADLESTLRTNMAVDELVFSWHCVEDDGHIRVLLISEVDVERAKSSKETLGITMGSGRCLTFAKTGTQWTLENTSKWIA